MRGATERFIYIPAAKERFQSTLPVRGATYDMATQACDTRFQSTLPVRGATISTMDGNVWVPGVAGWTEVVA